MHQENDELIQPGHLEQEQAPRRKIGPRVDIHEHQLAYFMFNTEAGRGFRQRLSEIMNSEQTRLECKSCDVCRYENVSEDPWAWVDPTSKAPVVLVIGLKAPTTEIEFLTEDLERLDGYKDRKWRKKIMDAIEDEKAKIEADKEARNVRIGEARKQLIELLGDFGMGDVEVEMPEMHAWSPEETNELWIRSRRPGYFLSQVMGGGRECCSGG